ncbi:NAD(P)H-quinone oxidoreductase [Pseudomaricurvus alcaniphilus]|uniref:NAD(P)H-quinone oxidoreductase n=1 Tax=Pseudomaricurvus alcaniphilus TaxID=1166482 RepID=UPI00140C328E|nr:NAD(P)H-quinone oxidoreductase [Pseudomaricurvus alcaniphilus]NHN37676.1 NAD(P)H-quinone oxidoreductase [Pseudomaricurvus alcaniphilus]
MRYVNISKPGDISVLSVETTEAPVPRDNEVLIDVAYAGVNRPDIFQRLGSYPVPAGASPIMGLEVSGRVAAIGSGVTRFQVGDQVCALTNGGGYAERVCAAETQCLPVPAGLTMAEAAALPETCFTVWTNVFDRGRLQPGEWLLVHGGASGIGTTAIQMAKALGARVIATASSDEKCQVCLDLGAEVAINYRQQDFVEQVRAVTDGHGADVILDMVGGDYIPRNIEVAAEDGRIVSIAFLRGAKVEVNFSLMMAKRLVLTGSTLRPQSTAQKAAIASQLQERVWPLIEAGAIRPLIAREYPLQEVAEAHKLMESNQLVGKIVLNMHTDTYHSYEN